MRVVIDPEVCQGHARCHLGAPELFGLNDDDGHAFVVADPVPPELEDKARRAAVGCPEQAIAVIG
ncbi:MAG TPA: ferredoxin [Acidimicrobiales bacterium]|jgi:ferredoxin